MDKPAFWDVDVKNLTPAELGELIRRLENSDYPKKLLEARRELVQRLRDRGADTRLIVKTILSNIYGKREKQRIAKKWAEVLGIDQKEIMRIYES
jgi:hypothetical protein